MTRCVTTYDLLDAYLNRRRVSNGLEKRPSDAHLGYDVLSRAFGVDFDTVPDPDRLKPPSWWDEYGVGVGGTHADWKLWSTELHALFQRTATIMVTIATPFTDVPDGPNPVTAYYARFGGPIGGDCAGLLGSVSTLLLDLVGVLWALPLDRVVMVDEL